MKFDDLPLLLKAAQAAKISGLSKHQLRELVKLGELEIVNVQGKYCPLYKRESLKNFLKLNGEEILRN